MENSGTTKIHGREEIKKYFRNGEIPSEIHFKYLIDSMVNKEDDGFFKNEEDGLHISSLGRSKRMITFYEKVDELTPFFYFEKNDQGIPGLRLRPTPPKDMDANMETDEASFFFHEGGKLGIGKKSDEKFKLDVKGFVGMEGRIGTYPSGPGSVPADGKWHPIITGLDNCQAFEVVARTGKRTTGKFAILHAIALKAYGNSRGRIRKTCAYYGFFWNRLSLKWKGNTHDYSLMLRSNNNYGEGIKIYYSITRLWDDERAGIPESYYYKSDE